MISTKDKGQKAEVLARHYLTRQGWEVLCMNYRYKRGEIDIIGIDKGVLVFVEVKFRKNVSFGFPEDFVTAHKMEMVRKTAEYYLIEKKWVSDIRFDIIAIVGSSAPLHFIDAF